MLTMRFVSRYLLLLVVTLTFGWLCLIACRSIFKSNNDISNVVLQQLQRSAKTVKTKQDCRFHSCFDVFRCQSSRFLSYAYPDTKFVKKNDDSSLFPTQSYEFKEIVESFRRSRFSTTKFSDACLFIPPIDLLTEKGIASDVASEALHSLPGWNEGSNHLIFNFFPLLPLPSLSQLGMNIGKAMIASPNFVTSNYRQGFDVSVPLFNSLTVLSANTHKISYRRKRRWKLVISQLSMNKDHRSILRKVEDENEEVMMMRKCLGDQSKQFFFDKLCKDGLPFDYPALLQTGSFCLMMRGEYFANTLLLDAMMMGCIPVIVMDEYVMPFDDVIDWSRASIRFREYQLRDLMKTLLSIDEEQIQLKRYQVFHLWKKYFSSIHKVVDTVLNVYNERVFINQKRSYEEWNGAIGTLHKDELRPGPLSPLLPLKPTLQEGFTAVILTYNRFAMLKKLMKQLQKVRSLVKMIVVWNNPYSDPESNNWPVLYKPWELIRTKTNRLTNRFYPFKEIETEAVMAIDDDILMLTSDEIEFAYQTWKEFPDRLVGFPARVHLLNPKELINGKRLLYKYESEWQNVVSMVLTGAAMYHQIYNHWFTYMLAEETRVYIDEKMNCEDIAMNFLISNLTGKAPIKVTPRKRFKCAQCGSNDSLWSETSHFIKRSECLSVFTRQFGRMPLRPVEYRADPVLFQESVPQDMMSFPDVGMV